jgi:hypothetical protein
VNPRRSPKIFATFLIVPHPFFYHVKSLHNTEYHP